MCLTCQLWYDGAMDTEITPVDERPLTTFVQNGLPAHYHELDEDEVSKAIARCTRTEVRILNLVAKGMKASAICKQLGLKRTVLTKYLASRPHFHDAYYTIRANGFSSENIRALAHSKAVSLVEHLEEIATAPFDEDTKPARLAVSVNASKELLTLSGLYKGTQQDATTVNIGQLLVQLSNTDDTPQWKR